MSDTLDLTPQRPQPLLLVLTAVTAATVIALSPPLAPLVLIAACLLYGIPAILWDIRHHLLPDFYTYPLLAVTGATAVMVSFIGHLDTGLRMLLVGAATAGIYIVLALVSPMGLGDAKLASAAAIAVGYYGWIPALTAFTLTYILAFPQALIAALRHTKMVPLGPAILFAYVGQLAWEYAYHAL